MSWTGLVGGTAKQGTIIAGIWREALFPEAALRCLYRPRRGMVTPEPPPTLAEAFDRLYGLLAGTETDAFIARSALATLERHWGADPRIPRPIEAHALCPFYLVLTFRATATNG